MNSKRVLIGAVAGGVAWLVWSCIVNMGFLGSVYMAEQTAGHTLAQPRYGLAVFFASWVIEIFLVAGIAAWFYAAARATLGQGPKTALKVGALLGFAAGVPINSYLLAWDPMNTTIPLWWVFDMWVGAILATLVAGFLYKDK